MVYLQCIYSDIYNYIVYHIPLLKYRYLQEDVILSKLKVNNL